MSSLSLGSSHMSAIFLASVSKALMFSSPSGLPWGSASQFCKEGGAEVFGVKAPNVK